jgi:hypothetical protein
MSIISRIVARINRVGFESFEARIWQLIIVCQESTTAINWLDAVNKMMVGPSKSLYLKLEEPPIKRGRLCEKRLSSTKLRRACQSVQ